MFKRLLGFIPYSIYLCGLIVLRIYRYCISPCLGSHCRFYPTCSQFAEEAWRTHSIGRATWLILSRLLRCHPWSAGGYHPVPSKPHHTCITKEGSL